MARMMLLVGLASALFLYDPQAALRYVDRGLEWVGWKQAADSAVKLVTPDRPSDPSASRPLTPPRR